MVSEYTIYSYPIAQHVLVGFYKFQRSQKSQIMKKLPKNCQKMALKNPLLKLPTCFF